MHLFNRSFKQAKNQIKEKIEKETLEGIDKLASSRGRGNALTGNILAEIMGKDEFTVKAFWKILKDDPSTWLGLLKKKKLEQELHKHFVLEKGDINVAKNTIQAYLDDTALSEFHEGDEDKRQDLLPPSATAGTVFYHTAGSKALDKIRLQGKTGNIITSHATVKSGAIIHPIVGQKEKNSRTKVTIAKKYLNLNNLAYDQEKEGEHKGEYIGWVETSALKRMKTIIDEVMGNVGNIENASKNMNRVVTERTIKFFAKEFLPVAKKLKGIIGKVDLGGNNIITKTAMKQVSKGVKMGTDKAVDEAVDKIKQELSLLLMETSTKLDDAISNAKIESGDSLAYQKIMKFHKDFTTIIVEKMIGMVPIVNKSYKIYKKAKKLQAQITGIKNEMIKALKSYKKVLGSIDLKGYEDHPSTEDLVMELREMKIQELSITTKLLEQLNTIKFKEENPILSEYEGDTLEQDIEEDRIRFEENSNELVKALKKMITDFEKANPFTKILEDVKVLGDEVVANIKNPEDKYYSNISSKTEKKAQQITTMLDAISDILSTANTLEEPKPKELTNKIQEITNFQSQLPDLLKTLDNIQEKSQLGEEALGIFKQGKNTTSGSKSETKLWRRFTKTIGKFEKVKV